MSERIKSRKFNRKYKEEYPSVKFSQLEAYSSDYKKRFRSKILKLVIVPQRDLGWNGIGFLTRSLQRSRLLYAEFVDNINRENIYSAYFATRGHYETTASVAYFLDKVMNFYNNQISFKELDDALFKLSLGSRAYPKAEHFPDEPMPPEFPDAINVLTQIDKADKVFNSMRNSDELRIFRESYDFLSEFCHPNLFGLTVGSKVLDNFDLSFHIIRHLEERDFKILINDMAISCGFFFIVYDKCYSLLMDNEEVPETIK